MKDKKFFDYLTFSIVLVGIIVCFCIFLFSFGFFTIPACLFITKFGFYCPACGATRAFLSLMSFDLVTSIKSNPFVFYTIFAIFVYFVLYIKLKMKKISETFLENYCKKASYIGISILLINWILRNVLLLIWHIGI